MKYASDFRKTARDSLRGRWGTAVIAGVLASMLGGTAYGGLDFNFDLEAGQLDASLSFAGQEIVNFSDGLTDKVAGILLGGAIYLVIAALVMGVAYFILGSVIGVGYYKFNLELVDRVKEPELGTLFGYFKHWRTTAAASLLQAVYVFLWSLLLLIPGIMAGYSYAMTNFILSEHPELSASEAIARSKELMYGNRWRLFCLQFSFIGWSLLSALTLGIGELWLMPYEQAATAAFYREISGTAPAERIETQDPEFL